HKRWREKTGWLSLPAMGVFAIGLVAAALCYYFEAPPLAQSIARVIAFVPFIFLMLRISSPILTLYSYLVAFSVLPLAILVTLILALPVGPGRACRNLILEVNAESAPPGDWLVHQLPPQLQSASRDNPAVPGLVHSAIYDDDRVHKMLC